MQQAGQEVVLKAWLRNGEQTFYICGWRDVFHGLFDSIGINLPWRIANGIPFFPCPSQSEKSSVLYLFALFLLIIFATTSTNLERKGRTA